MEEEEERHYVLIEKENGETEEVEIPSFMKGEYESAEMKRILSLNEPDDLMLPGLLNVDYSSSDCFPDWILQNPMWKNAPKKFESNEISQILNIPVAKRTQDQTSTLIHWLMSVWGIANTMGFKRVGAMFKEFHYLTYQPGENIVKEGERGLTFYIIISGTTEVTKDGAGVVNHLSKGNTFGEVALHGKDIRNATVKAETVVEVLCLHKDNYDIFVRDIQEIERRENFQLLVNCSLFKTWPKGKIEKMCDSCIRKTFETGQYIFRQGDPPEDLLVIVDGSVTIFKELVIVTKNRWPVGVREWKERVRRVTKPIMLKTLQRYVR
jgi:CRP-like cAMP-binding protein